MKTRVVSARFSDAEIRRLSEIAERDGVTISDVLRRAVSPKLASYNTVPIRIQWPSSVNVLVQDGDVTLFS